MMKSFVTALIVVASVQLAQAEGHQAAKRFYNGDENCLNDVVVPGVASLKNHGCDAQAYFLNPFTDIPPLCLFTEMTACSNSQTNASLYDFGSHSGVEIESILSYITGSADLTKMCVQKPYECAVGERFVDLTGIPSGGYGHTCSRHTCKGHCPDSFMLGTSPSFTIRNNIDNTQLLWTALGYGTGGKALHDLCIREVA